MDTAAGGTELLSFIVLGEPNETIEVALIAPPAVVGNGIAAVDVYRSEAKPDFNTKRRMAKFRFWKHRDVINSFV